jgi:HEAT repeat protein
VTELAAVLARWDELVVAVAVGEGSRVPDPVREAGTALRPPATEDEIVALERRVGAPLPPSYRAFLQLADGAWAAPGWGFVDSGDKAPGGLLRAREVDWTRTFDAELVDIWVAGQPLDLALEASLPESEYLDHERIAGTIGQKTGHLLHALEVGVVPDGWATLLNPLVGAADGEWEAWDFGIKHPGAIRHRTFQALLEADVQQLERRLARVSERAGRDVEALIAVALDPRRHVMERDDALRRLASADPERAIPLLVSMLGNEASEHYLRAVAAELLGRFDDPRALEALLAQASNPDRAVRAAVAAPLAVSPDAEARAVALGILTAPDGPASVARYLPRECSDIVWETWRATRDLDLLFHLLHIDDPRARGAVDEVVADASIPLERRCWFGTYASRPLFVALRAELLAAAENPDASLEDIGRRLLFWGEEEEGIRVLVRAVREGRDPYGRCAGVLAKVDRPGLVGLLVDVYREAPTGPLACVLGDFDDPDVRAALLASADGDELRGVVVYALEKSGAVDALAELAERGDLGALRALARWRDRRALAPLFRLLDSDETSPVFEESTGCETSATLPPQLRCCSRSRRIATTRSWRARRTRS